jgi:alkanesulfonate monooxygenase SsuD/methylene tetrahydromethanopterin reductase-like flavin-dependent oxidoreductase (luciferase family)
MEEILEILPQAWTGEPFHHQGVVYEFPELAVRPKPHRPVPVLIGGGAEAAIRRAARLADGIFANVPREQFLQQLAWIDDECDRIGRDPSELRIIHYSVMLPADNETSALDRYIPHLWQMMWKYRDMEDSTNRSGPPPAAPPFDEARRAELLRRSTIAGSSSQIVEQLGAIKEAANRDVEFVARSYFPTLPYEHQVELMAQLAEEVAPHV